jgi:hypothetical protein
MKSHLLLPVRHLVCCGVGILVSIFSNKLVAVTWPGINQTAARWRRRLIAIVS